MPKRAHAAFFASRRGTSGQNAMQLHLVKIGRNRWVGRADFQRGSASISNLG